MMGPDVVLFAGYNNRYDTITHHQHQHRICVLEKDQTPKQHDLVILGDHRTLCKAQHRKQCFNFRFKIVSVCVCMS
jgi:hypothetical protein